MSAVGRVAQLARQRIAEVDAFDFDATRVARGLYIGGFPPLGKRVRGAGFTVLVLCAYPEEYAHVFGPGPIEAKFDGVFVVRAHLDDSGPTKDQPNRGRPTGGELADANVAAARVAAAIGGGGRALVTCAAGRNRSAFVAALALHRMSGERGSVCMSRIRAARGGALVAGGAVPAGGTYVLTNPWFRAILDELR